MTREFSVFILILLAFSTCVAQQPCPGANCPIKFIIYIQMENRTLDEMFGTFPGVQNFCQGGHSPRRCTNNQNTSCTRLGTHDVCGNGGWCEPVRCITPTGTQCSAGDSCPQITTYETGDNGPLTLQNSSTSYADTGHAQKDFLKEFNNGLMNGWTRSGSTLVFYDSTQLPFHYQLASTYGLEDNHFSTMGGPSQPNHLYIFAASSNESSDNPTLTQTGTGSPGNTGTWNSRWTCGALHTGSTVPYLYTGTLWSTLASDGTRYFGGTCSYDRTKACVCYCPTGTKCPASTFDASHPCSDTNHCSTAGDSCDNSFSIGGTLGAPCPTITTIADVAEAKLGPNSWAYYSWNANWNAALQSQQIYFNPARLKAHVRHDTQFDTDVAACTSSSCALPPIVFLSPSLVSESEHPPSPIIQGETWLQTRLSGYFNNPYVYGNSVVFITWDDWGGKYDHVPPPVQDSVPTLGFRVPLLCVGPYCKNKVIHTQMEFASVLKCIERVFGLGNINSRDAGATDACAGTGTLTGNTDGMINLSQTPIPPL